MNNIEIVNVKKFLVSRGAEKALVELDIDFDLSSEFNWNVKQLFTIIKVSYSTSKYAVNEAVLFDKIITSPIQAKFKAKREFNKYALSDDSKELKDNNVTFTLEYEIMPYFGFIKTKKLSKEFYYRMPDSHI